MTRVTDKNGIELTVTGCGRCHVCKTIKPAAQFYSDSSRSNGLSSRCKSCDAVRMQKPGQRTERFIVSQLTMLIDVCPEPQYRRLIRSTVAQLAA